MPEVELSAEIIEYEDTGGADPAVVSLRGLLMDSSRWRHVVAGLRSDYCCVAPTLPTGGHRRAIRPDAGLSLQTQVRLVAEFLERIDLGEVTLVDIDTGGRFAQMRGNNIVHWSEFDRGGHFAAMEAPALLISDVREFFRCLRGPAAAEAAASAVSSGESQPAAQRQASDP